MLAESFVQAGHQVHVMTWTENDGDKRYPFAIVRHPTTLQIIKEHRWADVVFENNPCLRMSWPLMFFHKPLVIALHTWIQRTAGKMGLQDKLKMWWLKRADRVIACSDAMRKKSWPQALVIQNAYNSNLFKRQHGSNRPVDFVFLGRLVSDKGADLAIRALHLLVQQHAALQHTRLTIIGSGPELKELQDLAATLDLSQHIIFAGSVSGVALVNLLNQHRFLLVPSVWEEPFGIVVLEGMACGCVPIVSDGGGLPEAAGPAGIAFERNNLCDLADKMYQLLTNAQLENFLLGQAGMHLEKHTTALIAQQYLQVIEGAKKNIPA